MGTFAGGRVSRVNGLLGPILLAVGSVSLGGLGMLGGVKLGALIYKWLSDSGIMTRIFDAIDSMKAAFSDAGGWIKKKYEGAKEAVITTYEGGDVDQAALEAFCREHLAGYKVPRSHVLMAEIPRSSSGKILKRELRQPPWAGRPSRVG